MKNILLLILSLLSSISTLSQNKVILNELYRAKQFEQKNQLSEAIQIRKQINTKHINSKENWAIENNAIFNLQFSKLQSTVEKKLEYALKSASIYEKAKKRNEEIYFEILDNLYKRQYDKQQYKEAIVTAKKVLEIYRKTNNQKGELELVQFIGGTYDLLGNKVASINFYKYSANLHLALEGKWSENLAENYISIASLYSNINNFNEQLKYMNLALDIYKKKPPQKKFNQYNLYYYFVVTNYSYGDLVATKKYLDLLNDFYDKHKEDSHFFNHKEDSQSQLNRVVTIKTVSNIMYHKALGNENEVINQFAEFKKYLPKNFKSFTNWDILDYNDVYIQVAMSYSKFKKNYTKGNELFDEALRINQQLAYNEGIININFCKGHTLTLLNKWEEAKKCFEACLKYPEVEQYFEVISLYQNLAKCYYYSNQSFKAIKYMNKVMTFYNHQNQNYFGFESVKNLYELGAIYIDAYQKNKKTNTIKQAYEAYKKSSEIFSKIYQGDVYNEYLTDLTTEINKGLLYCATQLQDKKGESLELIERNASDYLWSNFLKKQNKNKYKKPLVIKDTIIKLNNRIDLIKSEGIANNKRLTQEKKNEINKLEKQKDRFQKSLKKDYPTFYSFSNDNFNISLFQKNLKNNQVIIKFITLDTIVYAYVIKPSSLEIHPLKNSGSNLKNKIISYHKLIKKPQVNDNAVSKELFNILIKPLRIEKNTSVTIITDGYLSYLPFETLSDGKNYWINSNKISYSNSIKLLEIQKSIEVEQNSKLIAFSPKYDKNLVQRGDLDLETLTRNGNFELKGAQVEATKIAKLFNGTVFDKEKASKQNFITNSNKYSILHLAMHGILNEDDDNQSSLLFSNNEKLFLSEFYDLNIPADMAVLSACNTGMGKYKNGEGIMSLSRALTYSGVKSSVYSLWQVPDKETSEIMISFYENLKNGQPKDEALANAKKQFLANNPMKQHPFYWAGFVVNGDVSPIVNPISNWVWIALAGGILIVILGFVFRKKLF